MIRAGSLCTGYGGLDGAAHAVVGGELAWVADTDAGASKILAYRFPCVPNLGDITAVSWDTVEPVDILTAGYPCQPFSDAGQRKGIEDERHIWPYVAVAIRVLRPRLVLLENVRGHLGRGFDTVLAGLAAIGFDAEWCTATASQAGAPHRRERLFILAWPAADPAHRRPPTGRRGAAEDADGATGGEWRIPAPGQAEGGWPWSDAGRSGGARTAADTERGEGGQPLGHTAERRREGEAEQTGMGDRRAPVNPLGGGCDGRAHESQREAEGGTDTRRDSTPATDWGPYRAAIRRWERITGRLAPPPTEQGKTGQRLSPRFVEWMQGLPDGWVTGVPELSRNEQLHALGNGVVPQQGALALRTLMESAGVTVPVPAVRAELDGAA